MGRKQKIFSNDVLEYLEENGQVTINALAEYFEVDPVTVRSRLRELRRDGEAIIHDKNGVMKIDRQMIENDEEAAAVFKVFIEWIAKSLSAFSINTKPVIPMLPALKRVMKETLMPSERKELASACLRIKMLVEHIDMENELGQ